MFIYCYYTPCKAAFSSIFYIIIMLFLIQCFYYFTMIYNFYTFRFRQGFKRVFFCCKWKEEHANPFEKRNFATVRHSYSEPYTETRVTINGSANLALQTVTESLNGSQTSSTPFLSQRTPRKDRYSNV